MEAVDTLIQARQCIQQTAASHGLRATCHPQPFPGVGSGAHAHISFNRDKANEPPGQDLNSVQMSFMAAVIEHLPALCAITMPQAESYGRVADDSWTGGTWIGWGTENREVPLRKSDTFRWEIKCLDGFANMYLAFVAIMSAGLKGVQERKEMTMKDCTGMSADVYTLNVLHDLPLICVQQILLNSLRPKKKTLELNANFRPRLTNRYQRPTKMRSLGPPCQMGC